MTVVIYLNVLINSIQSKADLWPLEVDLALVRKVSSVTIKVVSLVSAKVR